MNGSLAGGVLTEAGLKDAAHDALVDLGRLDSCTADGFTNNQRAQLRCGEGLERALELGYRGAHGRDDDYFIHALLSTGTGSNMLSD
jgi:hypothetical protein